MISLSLKLDRHVAVAVSSGVDSMAAVNFLSRNHTITPMFFHHGNDFADDERVFLEGVFGDDLIVGNARRGKLNVESQEEYWRNCRYEWFHSFTIPIITCHHLDDCVETWIWSSLHGEGKIIPAANKNVIRPFRLSKKEEFVNWARNNGVKWLEDESNTDTKFMRNYIRHELMQKALVVNPGLHKVIRKKIEKE